MAVRPKRRVSRFNLYGPGRFIASERGEGDSTAGYLVVVFRYGKAPTDWSSGFWRSGE